MRWNILYRGSLTSCNYDCDYCPFAKTTNTREELALDKAEVERFVQWAGAQGTRMGILFTPWGEALTHKYYRRALVDLSHLPNVYRVAIQTNLSANVNELLQADRRTLALWATFHPTQVRLERFVERCRELDEADVRYSVGVVGLRENFDVIEKLRLALNPKTYLWINAFKRDPSYYDSREIDWLERIDPYFRLNLPTYNTSNERCLAGESAFTVNGAGEVRRCHFISEVIGNIYSNSFPDCLKPRRCSAATCRCYIGYIHQPDLALHQVYGDSILARIPLGWPGESQVLQ